jgi:hypothetical protein
VNCAARQGAFRAWLGGIGNKRLSGSCTKFDALCALQGMQSMWLKGSYQRAEPTVAAVLRLLLPLLDPGRTLCTRRVTMHLEGEGFCAGGRCSLLRPQPSSEKAALWVHCRA